MRQNTNCDGNAEKILREEISRLEDELEKLRGLLAANPPPPPQPHPLWEERPPVGLIQGPLIDDLDAAVFEFTKFFTDAIDKGAVLFAIRK